MIQQTILFIEKRLNQYLMSRFPSASDWVVTSSVTGPGGTPPLATNNKIVLTLVNIERDATATATHPKSKVEDKSIAKMNPAMRINLDILVSAQFETNYSDGLVLLSAALGFFQGSSHYTASSAPDLPQGLDKLTTEWVDQNRQELHNLWTVLGGKYMPSMMFKLRMLSVQESWVTEDVPIITGTSSDVVP
ncbi:DUF4255 domain-containing protein [uncultured Litoreibacter sp.]|uniref:DUF4255 domain-containing protein n=1 Tax=uncultured Litoreibacter sp. TaxID=1392394 RepID=UPI0026358084|nr:DUF4255 domain-containing protein [uncultured Litoreibacter sp.]